MNTIWDIVLQAVSGQSGWKKSELFFRQAEAASPWYEQSFRDLNQAEVVSPEIEVNALCRFSAICQEILHPDFLADPVRAEFSRYLMDILLHWLSELDLRHGLTRREYYIRQLRRELCDGVFGRAAAAAMQVMDPAMQLVMAGELYAMYQTGSGLLSFRQAMRQMFPACHVYQGRQQPEQIYVYLDEPCSPQAELRLAFVRDTFLPEGFQCRLFWTYHFGILDVAATMEMDKIAMI